MSSDIPRARQILERALSYTDLNIVRGEIRHALSFMTRVSAIRRAPAQRVVITAAKRKRIKKLARSYPRATQHQIADAIGLRNSGRVSEVLHGKR
jgi:hypothetical protein